jgi:hypothetical protein
MPAACGCTTSKQRSSLWIFRVISRRCFAVHLVPVIWCWAAACFVVFFHSLGSHANLSTLNSTWPGPVGDPFTVSPSGSGRCSFQNNAATIHTSASTGAMLLYRAGTRQSRYAALAAEPRCASDFNLPRCLTAIPHFANPVSESYNRPNRVGLAPFSRALVGWHHQSLLGPGSRHGYGINFTHRTGRYRVVRSRMEVRFHCEPIEVLSTHD